jgi:hypothetical protein
MRAREFIIEGYREAAAEFAQSAEQQQVVDTIELFKTLVNKNQLQGDERNIDWWRKQGWEKFNSRVQALAAQPTKTQLKRRLVQGKKIVLQDDEDWYCVIPLDKNSSCSLGKNTKWCTARPEEDYFVKYFHDNYILIYCTRASGGEKYAVLLEPDSGKYAVYNQFDTIVDVPRDLDIRGIVGLSKHHEPAIQAVRERSVDYQLKQLLAKYKTTNSQERLPRVLAIEQLLTQVEYPRYSIYAYTDHLDEQEFDNVIPEVQNLILDYNPRWLSYLTNPTEEQKRIAIARNAGAISLINNPSYELQRLAVEKWPAAVEQIKPQEAVDPRIVDWLEANNPDAYAKWRAG